MVWRVWGFGLQVRGFRVSLWLGDSRVLVMGDVSFRVSGLTWRSGRRDGTKRCELKAVAYNCVYWGDLGPRGFRGSGQATVAFVGDCCQLSGISLGTSYFASE